MLAAGSLHCIRLLGATNHVVVVDSRIWMFTKLNGYERGTCSNFFLNLVTSYHGIN